MDETSARSKLIYFFQTHNPDRLSAVEDILQSYQNDYDQLFRDLKDRYPSIDVFGTIQNAPAASPSAQQQQQQSSHNMMATSSSEQNSSQDVQQQQQHQQPSPSSAGRGWTRDANSPSFTRDSAINNNNSAQQQQQQHSQYNQNSTIVKPGFAHHTNNHHEGTSISSPTSSGGGAFVKKNNYSGGDNTIIPTASSSNRSLHQNHQVTNFLNDPDLDDAHLDDRSTLRPAECTIQHRRYKNGFEEDVLELPNEATPSILFVPKGYFNSTGGRWGHNNAKSSSTSKSSKNRPTPGQIMRGEVAPGDYDNDEEEDYRTRYDPKLEEQRAKVLARAKREAEEFYQNHPEKLKQLYESHQHPMNQEHQFYSSTPQRQNQQQQQNGPDSGNENNNQNQNIDNLTLTPSQSPQRPRFLSPSLSAAWTVMTSSASPGRGLNTSNTTINNNNNQNHNNNNFWGTQTVRGGGGNTNNIPSHAAALTSPQSVSSATINNQSPTANNAYRNSHFLPKPEPFSLATSNKPIPPAPSSSSPSSSSVADQQQQNTMRMNGDHTSNTSTAQDSQQNPHQSPFFVNNDGKLTVSDEAYQKVMAAREAQRRREEEAAAASGNDASDDHGSNSNYHGTPLNQKTSIVTEYYRGGGSPSSSSAKS